MAGNLAMLDAFMGAPDAARAVIARERVGLVAVCRGNTEEISLGTGRAGWPCRGVAAGRRAGMA
ncbi:hypothetical protein ACVOMV_03070 [Mesorhizobium atlanticum]